jgi:cytochrome oxidase Cu insertion factor (SCO1/SenC/PrrC family)
MTARLIPLALVLLTGCGLKPRTATQPEAPIDLNYPVGEFQLTERSGRTVTHRDLAGKVWIASFIFTRCTGPCPQVTSTMRRLQSELQAELESGQLRLVTFTVDPNRDDLRTLQDYAKARGAHPEYWLFLTGDETTIHTLLREQFKQVVERRTGSDVTEGTEFDHSPRLVVVDRTGVIRSTHAGLPSEAFPDAQERFEADLARLRQKVAELLR